MPHTFFPTPIGDCLIAWGEASLTGFALPFDGSRRPPREAPEPPPPWVEAIIARVQRHLTGDAQDFADLPYDFSAVADFNRRVLVATLAVKSGQTATYGEIAATLHEPPGASRAVGAALGSNRWPLLIPCHRILAAGGRMNGFSAPGGINTKVKLLAIEGSQLFAE